MKKLLTIILISFSIFSFSQGILKEDFVLQDGKYLFEKTIQLQDGNNIDTDVDLLLSMPEKAFIGLRNGNLNVINMMFRFSNSTIKKELKNPYSYKPRKTYLMFMEKENQFMVSIEYTANNSYGGEVKGITVFTYDNLGDYVSHKSI